MNHDLIMVYLMGFENVNYHQMMIPLSFLEYMFSPKTGDAICVKNVELHWKDQIYKTGKGEKSKKWWCTANTNKTSQLDL